MNQPVVEKKRKLNNASSTQQSPSPTLEHRRSGHASAQQKKEQAVSAFNTTNQEQVIMQNSPGKLRLKKRRSIQINLDDKKMTSPEPNKRLQLSKGRLSKGGDTALNGNQVTTDTKRGSSKNNPAKMNNTSHKLTNSMTSLPKIIAEEKQPSNVKR